MTKTFVHAKHCNCPRCAPSHPSDQLCPGAVRVAVIVFLTVASWAAAFWAASELRHLLFTWS